MDKMSLAVGLIVAVLHNATLGVNNKCYGMTSWLCCENAGEVFPSMQTDRSSGLAA